MNAHSWNATGTAQAGLVRHRARTFTAPQPRLRCANCVIGATVPALVQAVTLSERMGGMCFI